MLALAIGQSGVDLVERPEPVPGPHDVVVAVHACGICGSDVHAAESGRVNGVILGHEFSGTVAKIGDQVHTVAIGQHVAVDPLGGCGTCPACTKRLTFLCANVPNLGISADGAFAERVAVPERQVHVLSNDRDLELGSHAEPLAVALRAIELAEISPGEDALVVGIGTIGLMVIAGLRALGAGNILAVGRAPGRRAAASAFGADLVLDARSGDLSDQLRKTGWRFAAAFESSGSSEILTAISPVMDIGATMVEVALPEAVAPVNLRALVGKGLRLAGSCAFAPDHYAHALELLTTGAVDPEPLVSERVTLEEAPDAFDRLRSPGNLVGILVEPWRH